MQALLKLAHGIDWINDTFGSLAKWAVILACFISAGNAFVRYGLDISSNGWLEIQWYLFAACVMLGAAQVLRLNEHVRVDLFYGKLSSRGRVWVDLLGLAFGPWAQKALGLGVAIAALTSAANKVPYSTGAQTWALADFSAGGRALALRTDVTREQDCAALVSGFRAHLPGHAHFDLI